MLISNFYYCHVICALYSLTCITFFNMYLLLKRRLGWFYTEPSGFARISHVMLMINISSSESFHGSAVLCSSFQKCYTTHVCFSIKNTWIFSPSSTVASRILLCGRRSRCPVTPWQRQHQCAGPKQGQTCHAGGNLSARRGGPHHPLTSLARQALLQFCCLLRLIN